MLRLRVAFPLLSLLVLPLEARDLRLDSVPISFEENRGQAPGEVLFSARARSGLLGLTRSTIIALATALFVLALAPSTAAQTACADSVQGRIAWLGAKSTLWTAANLAALCKGAEASTEPGKCFKRVMSGTVSYGGGTSWNPVNALRLCAGALDANARVACTRPNCRTAATTTATA